MAQQGSDCKHTASDNALDQEAQAAEKAGNGEGSTGPGHDPAEIAKHDDKGKDRLFEGREQRDHAQKDSEKVRLEKDADRHNHAEDNT